jgi:hypothetical protein
MFAGGLGGGLFLGFTLGVFVRRREFEAQRGKALEVAKLLIDAPESGVTYVTHPPPSASWGCEQVFLYEVIFGGGDGTEI